MNLRVIVLLSCKKKGSSVLFNKCFCLSHHWPTYEFSFWVEILLEAISPANPFLQLYLVRPSKQVIGSGKGWLVARWSFKQDLARVTGKSFLFVNLNLQISLSRLRLRSRLASLNNSNRSIYLKQSIAYSLI